MTHHELKANQNLMISVSGIRGTIPEGLNPGLLADIGLGFAAVTGKRVILGMDSRNTGPLIRDLLKSTLIACGKEVLDAELAPTPTVKAAVKLHNASGGIMISASHNPPQWNGLKLIGREGFFFGRSDLDSMLAAIQSSKFPMVNYKKLGSYNKIEAVKDHVKAVLKLLSNTEQIRKKKYTVVVDAVAGAGRDALPLLLEELGCKVIRLYCDPDSTGEFPRPPEPTPAALKKFSETLRKSKAACGFALDPDADRIVPGSPARGAINEEYSLALSFLGLPEVTGKPGTKTRSKIPFIVNLSTSTLLDQVAEPYGYNVLRSAVGEANVVAMMRKNGSFFGGEGNGGIIHSKVPSFGRDSLLGAGLILSAMAREGAASLDDLIQNLPALFMEKRKFDLKTGANVNDVFSKMEDLFPGMKVDRRDGLHLSNEDGWIHVRASNTEPVLRVIAEARNSANLKDLLSRAARAIK